VLGGKVVVVVDAVVDVVDVVDVEVEVDVDVVVVAAACFFELPPHAARSELGVATTVRASAMTPSWRGVGVIDR
jgi:hypothetical protein